MLADRRVIFFAIMAVATTASQSALYAQPADPNAAPNPYVLHDNWAHIWSSYQDPS